MPSLADFSRFFASLTSLDLVIGFSVTAAVILLVSDWRISVLALIVQYVLATVVLATIVQLDVAIVRLIGGALVAAMIYLTARSGRAQAESPARTVFILALPARLIALVLVAVAVIVLAGQGPMLNAPAIIWLVSLWLGAVGLLVVVSTRDALKVGMGLLTFTTGFGLLYLSLDPSLLVYGLLVTSDLVIALIITHLASAPAGRAVRRRGEM